MPRILLIGLFAGAFLIASALVSPAIEMITTFSIGAQAAENPNAARSKTSRPDAYIKRGKQGGGPAGIAVSDPGAEGSKPTKKKNK